MVIEFLVVPSYKIEAFFPFFPSFSSSLLHTTHTYIQHVGYVYNGIVYTHYKHNDNCKCQQFNTQKKHKAVLYSNLSLPSCNISFHIHHDEALYQVTEIQINHL